MILVALGANLPTPAGDPRATLDAALAALRQGGIGIGARSAWYRTPAFPPSSGPDFVNGAAALATELPPAELLARLHAVERSLGRVRGRRWAPRACDLDLIAYGGTIAPDRATLRHWMDLTPEAQARKTPEELILPHPRLHQRGFVLLPLADIAPDWAHPLLGRSVRAMLFDLPADALSGIKAL